jgi:hypothetical protein
MFGAVLVMKSRKAVTNVNTLLTTYFYLAVMTTIPTRETKSSGARN